MSELSGHHHHDHHHHDHRHMDKRVLKIGFWITVVAMVIEFAFGILSNSLALISDAIHMFSHAFALGLSLIAIIIAGRLPNAKTTYGYHRAEVLAAFVNGLTIAASVIWIVYEAIWRLFEPNEIDIKTMMIVAVFGLVVNIATGLILMRGDHGNVNIRSAFLHMLTDALSSVGVVLGGVVMYYTGYVWIDTMLAFIIALVIAKWSYGLLKEATHTLLAGTTIDTVHVKQFLLETFPEIKAVHYIRVSDLTHRMHVLTACVVFPQAEALAFPQHAKAIQKALHEKFGITHVTVQPEWEVSAPTDTPRIP